MGARYASLSRGLRRALSVSLPLSFTSLRRVSFLCELLGSFRDPVNAEPRQGRARKKRKGLPALNCAARGNRLAQKHMSLSNVFPQEEANRTNDLAKI